MINRGIHEYYIQDTWLLGSFSRTIQGHVLIKHDVTTKPCHRGRMSRAVAIILGPTLLRDWKMAWKPLTITSDINFEFPGRMIGVSLCFPTDQTSHNTSTTRGAKGISIYSCLWSNILWNMMNRSTSTRNGRVSTTPFPETPNSYLARASTPTSASGPRCSVM